MCMWRKYDSPLGRFGSFVSTAVSAIPNAFAVLCDIFVHRMPLRMIQQAHFTSGFGVGGHLHVADFFAALFTLPFCPVNVLFFPGFVGGAYLFCPGELCRGVVEVVFFTPFHGGIIPRKRKEIKA